MDFSLDYTEEQEEFAKEVREWFDENIPKDLVTNVADTIKMPYEQYLKRREFGRKLGEKGWLNPSYPRQYGGGELDEDHCFVIHRELAKRNLTSPPYYDTGERRAGPPLMAYGTEEQKQRFLPHILKGEWISWQCFTEPEAGTDEANQQTNALRHVHEGDHFIINGQKIFNGGGPPYARPDYLVLLTRSDLEAPRHANLAMFFCPANLPGVSWQPLGLFTPGEGDKYTIFLDDVRVHESYLIGGDHDGWRAVNATLEREHAGASGGGGIAGAVAAREAQNSPVERFLNQCRSNPNVVKRLRENPQLLDSLVKIFIGAEVERLFAVRNAWLASSGRRAPHTGTELTLYQKTFRNRNCADIAAVLGPYAFTEDDDWALEEGSLEAHQRSALVVAPAGTPEALKIIMSRALGLGR